MRNVGDLRIFGRFVKQKWKHNERSSILMLTDPGPPDVILTVSSFLAACTYFLIHLHVQSSTMTVQSPFYM